MTPRRPFVLVLSLLGGACGPEFDGNSVEPVTTLDARGAAGTGAAAGRAGESGAPAGSAGVAADGGTAGGGSLGTGGATGSGASGEDAGAVADGSLDAPAQPDACVSTTFYLDSDSDGYGGTSVTESCRPPGIGRWVTTAGDCDDNNEVVHPGQTNFFAQGYTKTGGTSVSFDYDCNGHETESGNSPKGSCQVVSLTCVGSGYLIASPPRSGPGVDPYCGSTASVNCSGGALNCRASAPFQTPPIACR